MGINCLYIFVIIKSPSTSCERNILNEQIFYATQLFMKTISWINYLMLENIPHISVKTIVGVNTCFLDMYYCKRFLCKKNFGHSSYEHTKLGKYYSVYTQKNGWLKNIQNFHWLRAYALFYFNVTLSSAPNKLTARSRQVYQLRDSR